MCDKKEQALGHIKEAEKHLKTGFLKWKPDLDLAADEFNKAATCYRVVGAHDECRQCLTRCAACHTETGSLFAAGRCYEQAALMSKELNQLATVANLTARAADLYQQQGSHDAALRCLEKGGAMLEQKDPDGALAMFQRAAEVVLIDERHREAAGLVSKVSRLLVRLARYDEALASVRKEMDYLQEVGDAGMQNRLVVVLVLLQLARDDVVAARLTFNQWSGVCEPQELSTLSQLLEGFEEGDGDMAARALAAPFIRHMDVEYSRLAASLQPPASNNCQANTDVGTAAAKGSSAEDGQVGDGDLDFGGALC